MKLEQLTTNQGGNDKKKKKSSDGGDTAKTEEVSGDQGGITIVEYDTGAGGDKESEEKGTVLLSVYYSFTSCTLSQINQANIRGERCLIDKYVS